MRRRGTSLVDTALTAALIVVAGLVGLALLSFLGGVAYQLVRLWWYGRL